MFDLKNMIGTLLFLVSTVIFAGTMGPVCTPGNATIPCETSFWDIGGQALFLQPNFSSLNYVATTVEANTIQRYKNIGMGWGWGFKLEGSYHFQTGNDLNLNWYHLHQSTTRVFSGTIGTGASEAIGFLNATLAPSWDAVNLEFGQHIDFTPLSKVRYHAGIAYGRIHDRSIVNAAGFSDGVFGTATIAQLLIFNGFGPRVGADLLYQWDNGFGLYAKSDAGLLIGNESFNRIFSPAISGFSSLRGSQTALVPEVGGKLGATYSYVTANGVLSADAGWMWINYFNALQVAVLPAAPVVKSSFSLQGLYFGLKWLGNFA